MEQGNDSTPSANKNDGKDPNILFWLNIKEHYLDHPDDNLISALVENVNLNRHLQMSDTDHFRVGARLQDNAIQLFSAPYPQHLTPAQANTESVGSTKFLSDPHIHDNLFLLSPTLPLLSFNMPHNSMRPEKYATGA